MDNESIYNACILIYVMNISDQNLLFGIFVITDREVIYKRVEIEYVLNPV